MPNFSDPRTIGGAWRCPDKKKYVAILNCLNCSDFPCEQCTDEMLEALRTSPFVRVDLNSSILRPRRVKMFLFLNRDGSIEKAYDNFDLENPDWDLLQDVVEVLYVNKSYTKQMKLVAKPKEERAEVHAELGPLEPVQLKKRRGRKAA